ncbi:MAG: AraC family transcriptional regulator [Clostridia bacterium]|nr:AraC family transcriptional regulator [Clostridia bacterium]
MKVLYIQNSDKGTLENYGVSGCYLKYFPYIVSDIDKTHCHNDFEIHMITKGYQCYEVGDMLVKITEGSTFIIPPGVYHRIYSAKENTEKITLYFKYDYRTNSLLLRDYNSTYLIDTPQNVIINIDMIKEELKAYKTLSKPIIENRILDVIINLFRIAGNNETALRIQKMKMPPILIMAQNYIENNIEMAPSVSDVANHCNISVRQLLRVFLKYEGVSAFDYIKNKRIEEMQKLLADKTLSLKVISERMNFSSEYYMNVFFKKSYGLPPGEYRKML